MSLSTNLESAAYALSVNHDRSLVVVAGAKLLKVFSVQDDGWQERYNLRIGRHPNLRFSALDVDWSPIEVPADHLIATAATNGSVVIWNLNRPFRNKQDAAFSFHRRAVNKVAFHVHEAQLILSGSQDGTVKLFDLRWPDCCTATFEIEGCSEGVRDVQFSPLEQNCFATADDGGNVRCWDLRNVERPTRQFAAHSGPVFCLDYHPTNKSSFATGGRDKLIKEKPTCEYVVQTTASLNSVRWRPNREWHLASCSSSFDFSINVWDIRRPFIPFAAFEEHTDVPTGICWVEEGAEFLSCGKDGMLIQHSFDDAVRPANFATPVCVDVGPSGDVACALSSKLEKQSADGGADTILYGSVPLTILRQAAFAGTKPNPEDNFVAPVESSFYVHNRQPEEKQLSMAWFVETAKRYRLHNDSFGSLCEFNAGVAKSLDRPQVRLDDSGHLLSMSNLLLCLYVAETWLILQTLYDDFDSVVCSSAEADFTQSVSHNWCTETESSHRRTARTPSQTSDGPAGAGTTDSTVRFSDVGSRRKAGEESADDERPAAAALVTRAGGDFFFGEMEVMMTTTEILDKIILFVGFPKFGDYGWNKDEVILDGSEKLRVGSRKGSESMVPPPLLPVLQSNSGLGPVSPLLLNSAVVTPPFAPSSSADNTADEPSPSYKQPNLLSFPSGSRVKPPKWDPSDLVRSMLIEYAESSDVQSAVSILLVLGADRVNALNMNDELLESWYCAYFDLLDRFEQYDTAARVVKLCPIASVCSLSEDSTCWRLFCGRCGEELLGCHPWLCDRCSTATSVCAICTEAVRGVWFWCQDCGHGGHPSHIRNWFAENDECPAGCGHVCHF